MIKIMRFNSEERLLLMTVGIYLAFSAGELRIVSADPNTQPALDYNYLSDPIRQGAPPQRRAVGAPPHGASRTRANY